MHKRRSQFTYEAAAWLNFKPAWDNSNCDKLLYNYIYVFHDDNR